MLRLFVLSLAFLLPHLTLAEMAPRQGWSVTPTPKTFTQLIDDLKSAAKSQKFGIVTQAGPTKAAAARGIEIPGNRIIGVFNNDYAVRVLNLSTPAMIEAPVRFYVTENTDGTATLSYKLPTTVFAPYMIEAGPELEKIAKELDSAFAAISSAATQ
jgi:uncharacterized protein (DUF302 family)